MTRNIDGLKNLGFDKRGHYKRGSCALCEQQLFWVGLVARCVSCRAIYILNDTGLLVYLGKSNERCRS